MKLYLLFCLLVGLLCGVHAEITPRFPGVQPIVIAGTGPAAPPPTNVTGFVDKTTIDPFTFDTAPPVLVQTTTGAPPSVSDSSFDKDSSILGGERDVVFTVTNSQANVVFSCGASGDAFQIATPKFGSGFVDLVYDGVDGSAAIDSTVGLGGLDLTLGEAIGFRIAASTDVDTTFTLTVYDNKGANAVVQGDVPGDQDGTNDYFLNFSDFKNVDFTKITAIAFRINAFENVDFELETFVTYGDINSTTPGECFTSAVLPCDTDYYNILAIPDLKVGDYVVIEFNSTGEITHPDTQTVLYVAKSKFDDLEAELASNENIIDTLGALPGPNNYLYKCVGACKIEIVWSELTDETYYLAVEGNGNGISLYTICLAYRSVPVFQLFDRVPEPIFFDQRPDEPPTDFVRHYRYYVIDVPSVRYSPGVYLDVSLSFVSPFPGAYLRLMYESLPEAAVDTGILGTVDSGSDGNRVDDVIYPHCVDIDGRNLTETQNWLHPTIYDQRHSCECFSGINPIGAGPLFQLGCSLVVDPCHMLFGNWYISVELPARAAPTNPLDLTGFLNYTIEANVVIPVVDPLQRNVTIKDYVAELEVTHYVLRVPAVDVVQGNSHLLVHVSNVRNGYVDVYVHRANDPSWTLAGGRETCVPANATCHTCDACNIVIEKCHFIPGDWYISVEVGYERESNSFLIFDTDRLPITYTIRATWVEDPVPERLVAGVPVSKYIGEALYDFYVIDVPPTIDTWLFVELYAKAEDTEVILSILHGELPGGECYARPDFYCMTGDPRGLTWNTGTPTFYEDEAVQRESCSFMIQTCELEAGPLFLSVYGHHTGYEAYGDTTFYQVPVHYTLWADFDVALALTNGASYSETVFAGQYQHYYIRADQIKQGSSLSVEVTNIRHGIPQVLQAFVNYNYLAGNCPCYDHLYNCTGTSEYLNVYGSGGIPRLDQPTENDIVTCCTIVVPPSDFRPGVWYVSVLGINEDYYQYTTPIGYTLTVTIHDAPTFNPLFLGQTFTGEVPQWNKTLEYSHFKLAATALPLNDLVIKITFVQNCEFLGKLDDHNTRKSDAVWLFVNSHAPATALGWDYHCKADIPGDSHCTIVVPHCEWVGDNYFISVQGDYESTFTGRFTLKAWLDEVRDFALTDGVSQYDRVGAGRYKHYFITETAQEDLYLEIVIYVNTDQDTVTAYLNKDERAGEGCFRHLESCRLAHCCTWQLKACELEPGRYYISVQGDAHQFYDTSVEYTLTATHRPVAHRIYNQEPVTGHLTKIGDVNHYYIEIDDNITGEFLVLSVDNVKHGSVQAYVQYNYLAGRCPCYIYEHTCTASGFTCGEALVSGVPDYCDIRIPTCALTSGTYFFSIFATATNTPDSPIWETPVGYVVEAYIVVPRIDSPIVDVGRNLNNFQVSEYIADRRYAHYRFKTTTDDFSRGYHIITEITRVTDGALFVYYNPISPSDQDPSCHLAQMCTNGLGSGTECHWQLPWCVVRPLGPDQYHYITVEGRTGRQVAFYNLIIYKQPVPEPIENVAFSLDDDDDDIIDFTSLSFPNGTELNVTHHIRQEPNGWTQFIKLNNVDKPDPLKGDMLELFFYRITNNAGQPMSFNVYVAPNEPAGAHGCCNDDDPVEYGSCQNAPCAQSADTTTSVNNAHDVFTHTCSLGLGVGVDDDDVNVDPFFGARCTVRVWPCEFAKYCSNTTDWFVSVVPQAPTDPGTAGPGLQYSFQWRSRNIRLSANNTVGSIDLTNAINAYNYTQTYTIVSGTTESQGYLSFYLDWEAPALDGRLSIQTAFLSGVGEVFINGDEFASETDTCNDYVCTTSSSVNCNGDGRFIVTEACSNEHKRYWITVRNLGPHDSTLTFAFRIVSIKFPAVVQITPTPHQNSPFVATSGTAVFANNINGVEGDNYDFYTIDIDDDEIDAGQSWVVIVTLDDNDLTLPNNYQLDVFIYYGAKAGLYGADNVQAYYGNEPEGSHAWQWACSIVTVDSSCVFQLPHCAILEGHWFISIYNPDFLLNGIPLDLPSYTFVTLITDVPYPLKLDEQVVASTAVDFQLIQQYAINITADNIDFDPRTDYQGYWVKYLRFQIDNIPIGGSLQFWVNYGDVAGPSSEYPCYGSEIANVICSAGSCYADVTPCEYSPNGFKLKTGTYYVGVRQLVNTTYTLLARVYRNEYEPIPVSATITGTGHRTGATDVLWRHTSTDAELNSNGTDANYRYIIDPVTPGDSDDLDDNYYYFVNLTAIDTNTTKWRANDTIQLEVWRDDCTRYECALNGPDSWCTIDAIGLAPCTAKSGRFFFRITNFGARNFVLDFYRNETVIQTLENEQIITEIVFPYEYQEYYYEAFRVGQGATLSVNVCAICGDVQVFIRKDLPAGPATDFTDDCAIDSCQAFGPKDTSFNPTNNCCSLFLDTCEYEQRGYYIGIRGVDQVYPDSTNPNLYLPIKYNIQAVETIVKFIPIVPSCPYVVHYEQDWNLVPIQYVVDIESINIGTQYRVSLRLPLDFEGSDSATILARVNSSLGFEKNSGESCNSRDNLVVIGQAFCSTNVAAGENSCYFDIPYCAIKAYDGTRIYLFADAPRGTEILVQRWDPVIPQVQPNLNYYGSINGYTTTSLVDGWDVPFTPNLQYYKVHLGDGHPVDDEDNYYEKFYTRIVVSGDVAVVVNSGLRPVNIYADVQFADTYFDVCETVTEYPSYSSIVKCSAGENCYVEITYDDLSIGPDQIHYPTTFWITVVGQDQQCELHSIPYSLVVQTHWVLTYLPVDTTICDSIDTPGTYNFHRLRPHQAEYPQQSILAISVVDLDDFTFPPLNLFIRDHYLATFAGHDVTFSGDADTPIQGHYICGYDDLYLSLYSATTGNYRITVDKVVVPVKELFDDSTYHADDDDDDACPHPADYYIFKTAQPLGHHDGSFFRVAVDSEFNTQVYVNRGSFAWEGCSVSEGSNDPTVSGTTTVNVYDFCGFEDGVYYITVVSDGPYYIYTDIRDDAKELSLGKVFRDTVENGMYQVYKLEVCRDWFEPDDRLVVEIADIENGDVYGWIRYENVGDGTCTEFYPALARYGEGQSGYDFLLVDTAHLRPGTYYILIRGAPHPGTPNRNCQEVNYRLFPYLVDYNIDPVALVPNFVITDVVDDYYLNRIVPESIHSIRYYSFTPFGEPSGYGDQSHAVVRLINVEGGYLTLFAQRGHLAIPDKTYIGGEIQALTKLDQIDPISHMQSGNRPFVKQTVIDPSLPKLDSDHYDHHDDAYDFCSDPGTADLCVTMSDTGDHYARETSAALWLSSCYLPPCYYWEPVYFAVFVSEQFYQDHPVTYDLLVHQTRDYILLPPDHQKVGEFKDGNWDYDFFYSISSEPESMRWRVVVTDGEGVLVTVRNHRCPHQATFVKEVWCDADYFDRPWMCDIEIPTRASHPGNNAYFVSIYGKNATYSLGFWRGRSNCHDFTGTGRNEGLNFCSGLVPYTTWRWDNYDNLDKEAHCLFEQLYSHFRVQPCWSGVSPQCNATLQAFSCYENFHRCDAQGFSVGTCRDACDAVVYECVNWFESVDLEHYNCTSHRYLDSRVETCTGGDDFSTFNEQSKLFLGDNPDLILFKSSPAANQLSSSATSLSVSFIVVAFAFLLSFVL